MAYKRVLEGATELKELITYRDKTKTSVGYGQAGQVLKTDGRHTYWGEEGISNLEAIKISGSIDWESYDNSLEFTEENYQQFLQNKTAPVIIDGITYTLSRADPNVEDEGYVEYYYTYQRITPEKIYYLSIGWNPTNYGYSDEYYVEEIEGSGILEPIWINGTIDWENGTNTLVFTEESYQSVVTNVLSPITINEIVYTPYKYLGEQNNLDYIVFYSHISEQKNYIISIYWQPNGETCVEDFYIEPIGGSSEIIKDVETVSSGGNPFVWNLETGERSEKIYINTTLSYDEILATLKQVVLLEMIPNEMSEYVIMGNALQDPPVVGILWDNIEGYQLVLLDNSTSGSGFYFNQIWRSHNEDGSENRTNNGWSFNTEHTPDGYLDIDEQMTADLSVLQPDTSFLDQATSVEEKQMMLNAIGGQNDKLSRLISSTTDFGGLELEEDQLYRIPTDDTYRLVHAKNGVAFEVANEDDVAELDKRVEALEGDGSSVSLEPIKISGTIIGWGNDFSIDNVEITEEHYNQFVQNKYAPISLKNADSGVESIFTLFNFEDYGNNNAYCWYEHIYGRDRHIICIEWNSGDGIIDDTYYEQIGNKSSEITDFTGASSFPENLIINSEWEVNEAVQQKLKSIDKFIYTDSIGVTAYFTLTSRIDLSDGNKNWGYLLFTTTINHPIDGIHNCYFQCNEGVTYVKYYAVKVS